MVTQVFQGVLNKIAPSVDRILNILDKNYDVIASSHENEIGKSVQLPNLENITAAGVYFANEQTYQAFGNKLCGVFCVSVSGTDDIAKTYCAILTVTLDEAIKYYSAKYDKCTFIKWIIMSDILPSDIPLKQRELKITDNIPRVCIIIRSSKPDETLMFDIIQQMFPDKTKDFVIITSETDVTIVKDITDNTTDEDLFKLASSIVSMLSSEHFIKCVASIGMVTRKLQDLALSFQGAQMALEIRKIFGDESNIVLYNKLGLARLIYQLPKALCRSFLGEIFKKGSVDMIDSELMFTINKFFENSLNISETSRKLFVHRNTLVYRLEKLKRLTGLDLREFEDSIVFKVALMVHEYLNKNLIKY
ncbi:MAG: helix-turn-helix domain-containing protein [Candidatus Improbicoccus devescovinae]|nr:MAG: helix-turn-helix domain-containing protein [Candidatus Improbicoccus devescovinae]